MLQLSPTELSFVSKSFQLQGPVRALHKQSKVSFKPRHVNQVESGGNNSKLVYESRTAEYKEKEGTCLVSDPEANLGLYL